MMWQATNRPTKKNFLTIKIFMDPEAKIGKFKDGAINLDFLKKNLKEIFFSKFRHNVK